MSWRVLLAPAAVAVRVTVTDWVTSIVVTVKFAVVDPAGTVMEAGTYATSELRVRLTMNPVAGAAADIVTCPATEPPPMTVDGVVVTDSRIWADTMPGVSKIASATANRM
jgi:hypothetical protein